MDGIGRAFKGVIEPRRRIGSRIGCLGQGGSKGRRSRFGRRGRDIGHHRDGLGRIGEDTAEIGHRGADLGHRAADRGRDIGVEDIVRRRIDAEAQRDRRRRRSAEIQAGIEIDDRIRATGAAAHRRRGHGRDDGADRIGQRANHRGNCRRNRSDHGGGDIGRHGDGLGRIGENTAEISHRGADLGHRGADRGRDIGVEDVVRRGIDADA